MAKILCVDDSADFFIYLTSILREHRLTQAESLQSAFKLLENGRESFDLLLLDISLPDGNGIKVLPTFKGLFKSRIVPIIVLSSDNDILSKVAAFGIGADDYVSKPFEVNEFRARVEARLRVARVAHDQMNLIQVGNLSIDIGNMAVDIHHDKRGKIRLELTPFEFKILKVLSARPGQVYSRDQLIDQVWGTGKFITERTVDAHVSHLRKKILDSTVKIKTVLSLGYSLEIKGPKDNSAEEENKT